MPDPLIVQQMNAFRAALLREEAQQMQRMAARWLQLERSLDDSIEAVLAEIERRQAAGEVWARHTGPYARLEHYQALLRQVRSELGRFARYAEGQIEQGIVAHAEAGAEQAGWVLSGQTSRLNPVAVENIVAATQPAAAVGQLLAGGWPEAAVRMTDALVTGTALGWNPRKTAAAMRQGLQSGLQRSLVIARTEQLRAWREASRATYQASGVVAGYKRLAAKATRTCVACLLADGQFYELDQPFEEHPQGRCTLVPVLIGREAPEWESGRHWLERQPAATQRQLLGPAAYNAWQAGDLRLEELVERHEHPTWGAALQVRSLRSVLGSEQAARWVRMQPGSWRPERTDAALSGAIGDKAGESIRTFSNVRQVYSVSETWAHIAARHGAQFDVERGRAKLPAVLQDPIAVYQANKPNSLIFVGLYDETHSLIVSVKTLSNELWLESMYTIRAERLLRPSWRKRLIYEKGK